MNWPTSQDYNEAIQNAASSFSDPALKSGEVTVNAIGLPVPRSGNFADVYRFKGGDGKTWALKCFTRKVAGLQERYAKIDEHIGKANFPFTVGFNYLAEGIRIRGQWFPLLKMEWVEGFTLNEFVRENAGKPQYLHALTQMWAKLCARLRDGNFAHADLQHGNVLLVPGDAQNKLGLKLIDYDGMWVPSLAEIHSGEIGHPNFQHPLRLKDRLYNGDVDRFPHLVIACALRATLLGGRALWDKFDNGDNLLFKEADLRDPAKAAVFKTLWNLHDDVLCTLLGKLALAVPDPLRKTPWLDDLLLTDEGKKLRDDEEAKVVAMLGVGPHFTAPNALAAPAAVQNEFNEFAFEEDEASAAPVKTASRKASPVKDSQKPKKKAAAAKAKSKLPLYIGGGVAAALLVIVGIIAATSEGKKQAPGQQEVAKVEDNNKNTAPKVNVPPKKDKTGEVKVDNPTPKRKEEPPPKNDPIAKVEPKKIDAPPLVLPTFGENQAKKEQEEWATKLKLPVESTNKIGMKMILIPPSGPGAPGLPTPYYLGKYEVTQGEWELVMGYNPSIFGPKHAKAAGLDTSRFPVEQVSWYDSVEFCTKLSDREGLKPYYELVVTKRSGPSIAEAEVKILGGSGYHIPTDAEWEHGCRAGTKTKYHSGDKDEDLLEYAWFKDNSAGRVHAVGEKRPNAFGLYDMHGNVNEWNEEMLTNAKTRAPERIGRGGAWNAPTGFVAVSSRNRAGPVPRDLFYPGLRVARVQSSEAKAIDLVTAGPASLRAPFTKEQAEQARAEWAKFLNIPGRKSLDLGNGVKLELVLIPPGKFTMGSQADEKSRRKDEQAHEVTITKPFYVGSCKVTVGQFRASGLKTSKVNGLDWQDPGFPQTDDHPVVYVNWNDANAFCAWLNNKTGVESRLLTEAQWEYACRGGSAARFAYGDDDTKLADHAWCNLNSDKATHPVAQKPPNAWGIYDTHGNCFDWTADLLDAGYYANSPPEDPPGPATGSQRVLRGGSFRSGAADCRLARRYSSGGGTRDVMIGFRVAVTAPTQAAVVPPNKDRIEAKNAQPALLKVPFTKEQADAARAEWTAFLKIPERKQLVLGKGAKLQVVLIPPGEFMMGDRTKSRKVTISKPFYMAATETTQEQYTALAGKNPSGFSSTGSSKDKVAGLDTSKFPVDKVNWSEAVAFGAKIGAQLPSEAQWEYACRAGTTTQFHFGDNLAEKDANFEKKLDRTTKVGSYAPNAFGLHDMHGNIVEWCRDWFDDDVNDLPDTDPERTVKTATDRRVYRGGQWSISAGECRSGYRTGFDTSYHGIGIGFRIIIPVADQAAIAPPDNKDRIDLKKGKPGDDPQPVKKDLPLIKKNLPLLGPAPQLKEIVKIDQTVGRGALALSNSGDQVFAATTGPEIRVYKTSGGELVQTVRTAPPWLVAALPEDNRVACGSGAKLQIIDVVTKQSKDIDDEGTWNQLVKKLPVIAKDNAILIPDASGGIGTHNVADGKRLSSIRVPTMDQLIAVSCSQDGQHVLALTKQGDLFIKPAGAKGFKLLGNFPKALTAELTPNGKQFMIAYDLSPVVYNAANGKEVATFEGKRGFVRHACYLNGARQAVSAHGNGFLRLWDAQTGTMLQEIRLAGPGTHVTVSADGRSVAAVVANPNLIQVWRLEAGKRTRP